MAAFQDEKSAYQALKVLKEAKKEKLIGIVNAAVLTNEGGKLVVDDSGVYGGRFFATKDGFVVEGLAATDEGTEAFLTAGVPVEAEEASGEEKPAEA